MKSKNFLVIGLVLLICIVMYKKRQNVAEQLPVVSKKLRRDDKSALRKKNSQREINKQKRTKRPSKSKISKNFEEGKSISIYKSGVEGQRVLNEFKKKAYLKIPNFSEFKFADFSEDEVAILVGVNAFGDKLSFVASRLVLKTEDVIETLKNDPTFLNASDPDFKAELMKPVMNMKNRNGFSEIQVWKSSQNNRDYYMFYAPRSDGQGAYGILLDGEREKLEANEDYYEQQLLEIEAESSN